MTNLEKRKADLMKEMKELEILEKAEKIRNNVATKIEEKNRLFLSLENEPTICRMPLNSDARFKVVFNSEICDKTTCYFSETCERISNLLSNKKGSRKHPVKNKNTCKILYHSLAADTFTIAINDNIFTVSGFSDWESFKTELASILPRKKALALGLTAGQFSGLMQAKTMIPYIFEGKIHKPRK